MIDSSVRLSFKEPEIFDGGLWVEEVELDVLNHKPPFLMSKFEVEVGGQTPPECHPEREIWLIASGEGELYFKGKTHKLKTGDCVTFEPPHKHSIKNLLSTPLRIFSIWWPEVEN